MCPKIGRNAPCWCGSGEKYKRCHLNRESAKTLPFEALAETMRVESNHKQCLHPLAASGVCDKIVSAHTIQRSGVLNQITDSTNHVRTFSSPILEPATGRLRVNSVGWREASTFTGFCAKHDSSTFKPLESAAFDGSPKQCFLLGYRAICHEIHQKSGLLKSDPIMRSLVDRGLSAEEQAKVQQLWAKFEDGTRRGLADVRGVKSVMDQQILRDNYSGWSRAVVSFRGDLSVVSTGAVTPNRDFDGKQLQDLQNFDVDIEQLPFAIVATSDGGAAVFVWRTGQMAPLAFVESLLKKGEQRLPGLIVQFMFAYIENTYFSHRWWESLSEVARRQIEILAEIPDAYDWDFSYSFSKFVPWEITGVSISDAT